MVIPTSTCAWIANNTPKRTSTIIYIHIYSSCKCKTRKSSSRPQFHSWYMGKWLPSTLKSTCSGREAPFDPHCWLYNLSPSCFFRHCCWFRHVSNEPETIESTVGGKKIIFIDSSPIQNPLVEQATHGNASPNTGPFLFLWPPWLPAVSVPPRVPGLGNINPPTRVKTRAKTLVP